MKAFCCLDLGLLDALGLWKLFINTFTSSANPSLPSLSVTLCYFKMIQLYVWLQTKIQSIMVLIYCLHVYCLGWKWKCHNTIVWRGSVWVHPESLSIILYRISSHHIKTSMLNLCETPFQCWNQSVTFVKILIRMNVRKYICINKITRMNIRIYSY